jgi:hypothetical protein
MISALSLLEADGRTEDHDEMLSQSDLLYLDLTRW